MREKESKQNKEEENFLHNQKMRRKKKRGYKERNKFGKMNCLLGMKNRRHKQYCMQRKEAAIGVIYSLKDNSLKKVGKELIERLIGRCKAL